MDVLSLTRARCAAPKTAAAEVPSAAATAQAEPSGPARKVEEQTLARAMAEIFRTSIVVKFAMHRDPSEVITIYEDARTGRTIGHFPPDLMVQLAGLFDQSNGAVLDEEV